MQRLSPTNEAALALLRELSADPDFAAVCEGSDPTYTPEQLTEAKACMRENVNAGCKVLELSLQYGEIDLDNCEDQERTSVCSILGLLTLAYKANVIAAQRKDLN